MAFGFSDLPTFGLPSPGPIITSNSGAPSSGNDAFGISGAAGALNGLLQSGPGSVNSSATGPTPSNSADSILNQITSDITQKSSGQLLSGPLAQSSLGRIAAGVIGLVAITAGLLMFKTTQTIITTGAKAAARVA